ncbi:MAG: hypothetical protein IPP32_02885 [Bacteroidetes bacterium]|nr:hypothetical protein [Bacteroidota bacterium]
MKTITEYLPLIFSVIAIGISLKERKRGLSSFVYEMQIKASYELMEAFSNLNQSMIGWISLKRDGYHVHSVPYPTQTVNNITTIYNQISQHRLILSNQLLNKFINLLNEYIKEYEKMGEDIKYVSKVDWFLKIATLQNEIRKEFGIHKLTQSNKNIVGIPFSPKN